MYRVKIEIHKINKLKERCGSFLLLLVLLFYENAKKLYFDFYLIMCYDIKCVCKKNKILRW